MSQGLIITDVDLHAYFLGAGVGRTIEALRLDLARSMPAGMGWNAAGIMDERSRRCAAEDWQGQVLDAFKVCPHNLAERCLEAALLYRLAGSAFLPDLLPLALVLLQTDLHAYFTPSSRPYRDHLAHQARVAALAHVLLDAELPLKPWQEAVMPVLTSWPSSTEHHLLAEHLARLGLAEGLPATSDDMRGCLQMACLLAGLVHDLGYAIGVEAWLGGPETALDRLGIFPAGAYQDPPQTPLTRLYQSFFRGSGPGREHASLRSYVAAHPSSPHSLAGALWLAYLPQRLQQDGLLAPPGEVEPSARGRFELVCQLAALMVLAHDFPLDSESEQAEQGFEMPSLGNDCTMLHQYPGCTLFALADMLHEFGRPVIYSGPDTVTVRSPVLGLELVWPDEWTVHNPAFGDRDRALRRTANERCAELGLPADGERPARLEVFWVVEDSKPAHFPRTADRTGARCTGFDRARLGRDVPARLAAWGLDRLLCQRDLKAVTEDALRQAAPSVTGKNGLWLRPGVPATAGRLAIHPLSRYVDERRKLRDEMHLRSLS